MTCPRCRRADCDAPASKSGVCPFWAPRHGPPVDWEAWRKRMLVTVDDDASEPRPEPPQPSSYLHVGVAVVLVVAAAALLPLVPAMWAWSRAQVVVRDAREAWEAVT